MTDTKATLRIDKWLWFARFFKTRGIASKTVSDGKVRVDGVAISKPSRTVGVGDTLTFAQGRVVRVVRIAALGSRRGPATEAQTLYDDLSPPVKKSDSDGPDAPKIERGGRPNKKDRRTMLSERWSRLE